MNARTLLSMLVFSGIVVIGVASADDVGQLPEAKTQNGVTFLSGGVGKDQADAMKSAAKDYTLMLTCAASPSGEYLADVNVTIRGKSGAPVLETVTDGPFLLAKLAPGNYQVSAVSNGRTVKKTVRIGSDHVSRVNLYWPDSEPAQSSRRDDDDRGM